MTTRSRLALQNPNQSPLVVGRLIKQGADVNAKDVNGQTPLMLASEITANPDVIDQLVRLGADVNAPYSLNGYLSKTPLLFAAGNNKNPEVIKRLVQAGANINARCIDGRGVNAQL